MHIIMFIVEYYNNYPVFIYYFYPRGNYTGADSGGSYGPIALPVV